MLDPFERDRARRFRWVRDADRYLAAHWGMRLILAALVEVEPWNLRLRVDSLGKLHIAHQGAPSFSLSHCGATAFIGASEVCPVGIDFELHREFNDLERLARANLTATEWQNFEKIEVDQRYAAFLTAWTRKEAALKALGCGLMVEPGVVEVGLKASPSTWMPPSNWGSDPVQLLPGLIFNDGYLGLALHGRPHARANSA